jgi:hypothetical protein
MADSIETASLPAALQTLLPDGVRTVITGGTVSMNVSTPVPSAEIFSQAAFGIVKQDTLPILQRFRGFILYPLGEPHSMTVYVILFTVVTVHTDNRQCTLSGLQAFAVPCCSTALQRP